MSREPRYPSFRYPRPERRDPDERENAAITALMWGCLVVIVVALAEVAMLWWRP